ncbi:MAG TPA: DUF6320 domain-containing protein [Anseongella sp.]|nr:DUF6320 domain-containing protein [Anseongella sp.]
MPYCHNCGVELEESMQACPLCGEPAGGPANEINPKRDLTGPPPGAPPVRKMTRQQRTFAWEIVSIVLLSAIIGTLLVNFIINKRITWAEYPVAVCLVIFSYVSLFAFWSQRILLEMAGGFIASSVFLLMLDAFTGGIDWTLKTAIPILLVANLIAAALMHLIRRSRYRGVNLLAYIFIGGALLCVAIESILSFFRYRSLSLSWSMVVALCVLLVSLILLFVHFRLKKGRDLEKTFHI